MPPPLPPGSRRLASGSSSTCLRTMISTPGTLTKTPISAREFTTTTPLRVQQIPPESPRFISVPQPPQTTSAPKERIKGHLPVPRRVFDLRERTPGSARSRRSGSTDPRIRPENYVAQAMPKSKAELAGEEARTPFEAWRRRMADSRRSALEQGLKGLYQRQKAADRLSRLRSDKSAAARREAEKAPERADDVLTRPTVRQSVACVTAVALDPLRYEKAAESTEKTAAKQAAKSEARKDALQQLYLSSQDFIVTEQELEKRVEELFREDYHSRNIISFTTGGVESIWDVSGVPANTSELMEAFKKATTKDEGGAGSSTTREGMRQRRVSEELTGGKLDASV